MYLETVFSKYESNVTGSHLESSHPIAFEIDGIRIKCDSETREAALWEQNKNKSFWIISDAIEFKIIRTWEDDCQRCGSRIRWRIPKNAVAIY